MFVCYTDKRNICRKHAVLPVEPDDLDALVKYMSAWATSLTPEQRGSASELVGFVGSNGPTDDQPVLAFELLVLERQRPKMQFWADCQGVSVVDRAIPFPANLPFDVQINNRLGRLAMASRGRNADAPSICTSDELAVHLLGLKNTWTIHNFRYLRVKEQGGEFRRAPKRAKAAARPVRLPQEFDLGDPMVFGTTQGAAPGRLRATWSRCRSRR